MVPCQYIPNRNHDHFVVMCSFPRQDNRVERIPMFHIWVDQIQGGWNVLFLGSAITQEGIKEIESEDQLWFATMQEVMDHVSFELNPQL